MTDLKTWAADVLTLCRGFRAMFPDITDAEADVLTHLAARPLYYWRREQKDLAVDAYESNEGAKVFETINRAAGVSPGASPIAPKPAASQSQAKAGETGVGPEGDMAPSASNSKPSEPPTTNTAKPAPAPKPVEHYGKDGLTRPSSLDVEHPVKRENAASQPASGTPVTTAAPATSGPKPLSARVYGPLEIPANANEAWARLHHKGYHVENRERLTKLLHKAGIEDTSSLQMHVLHQDVPPMVTDEAATFLGALPKANQEEVCEVLGMWQAAGKEKPVRRARGRY